MSEASILCVFWIAVLSGLALFIYREERTWGEASPLALLLALLALPAGPIALVVITSGEGIAGIVFGSLLLLLAVASFFSGALIRWSRPLALLAAGVLFLTLPLFAISTVGI